MNIQLSLRETRRIPAHKHRMMAPNDFIRVVEERRTFNTFMFDEQSQVFAGCQFAFTSYGTIWYILALDFLTWDAMEDKKLANDVWITQ